MPVLGMIEFASIARGILAGDAMVKAAPVEVLALRPVDPGKYLAAVTGDLASVEAAVAAGVSAAGAGQTLCSFVLANLHEQVLPVLQGKHPPQVRNAAGVIETRCAIAAVEAADAACKTAPVTLATLRLALRIGGKGYLVVTGDVADVEAAIERGAALAGPHLLQQVVIPNPYDETLDALLDPDRAVEGGGL